MYLWGKFLGRNHKVEKRRKYLRRRHKVEEEVKGFDFYEFTREGWKNRPFTKLLLIKSLS